MPRGKTLTLTDKAALGLFYLQRYRFLTIDQFARCANFNRSTAADQLRCMARHGLLGHFGNTGLAGHGKAPKVYFLTRKGWEVLTRESDIPPELIGTHKKTHLTTRWSPQMYHRLQTVDLMISAEVAVRSRSHLTMIKTFLEYRRVKRGSDSVKETTDDITGEGDAESRIVPDAAFIIENIETQKRALFFVEMDRATEPIVSSITRDSRMTLHHKIAQYDRYLQSLKYAKTYSPYGAFTFFTLLLVTLSETRVDHIRQGLADLPVELSPLLPLDHVCAGNGGFFRPHLGKPRSLRQHALSACETHRLNKEGEKAKAPITDFCKDNENTSV
jgi:hypothetical protein